MLGVEAMSLYRYVPGRENLLDAVVERIVDEMRDDDDVLDAPRDGWQDFLQRLAHGVRRVALAHPQGLPAGRLAPAGGAVAAPAAAQPRLGRGLPRRPARGGLQRRRGRRAPTAPFTSFLLGHLLLEVATLGADVGPLDVIDDAEDRQRKSRAPYPTVRPAAATPSAEDHAAVGVRGGPRGPARPDRAGALRGDARLTPGDVSRRIEGFTS